MDPTPAFERDAIEEFLDASFPAAANAQLQQAMAHHRAGRLELAEPIYRQLLSSSKNDPNLLHLLGLTLAQSGRAEEGIGLIRQAVQLLPGSVDFRANLAAVALILLTSEAGRGIRLG